MEPLSSMSGSNWNFWKFAYDHGTDYKLNKVAPVETFEELKKFNTQNDGAYLRYFRKFWENGFFGLKYVNGIYCNPSKISTWTSECDEKCFREKFSKFHYSVSVFHITKQKYEIKLARRWALSFFENEEFVIQGRQRFMKNEHPHTYYTDLLEKVIKVILNQFNFNESVKGIILTPSNLSEDQWRIPHPENRFVYSSIGVYLSGQREIRRNIPWDRVYETANEMAFNVSYKIKEILLSFLSAEEKVNVTITNAVPSEGIDFIDRFYEFSDSGKTIFSRI
uniref:Uncharacterized protein n=1 Tax=Panagrolaimus sp. ES5 TaxID=591445 RepID=A0AC34F3Y6_9BILA